MTPKERAILALECKQPDYVPHFELEMQLTEEYFKRDYSRQEDWDKHPSNKTQYMEQDADLFLLTANTFDYCIVFYSCIYRHNEADYRAGVEVLRNKDAGKHLLMAHGDSTMEIPSGNNMVEVTVDLFEHPQKIKDDQEYKLEEMLERGRKLLQAGLDGFILCSDYCFNKGPFLSPSMFGEFVTPYLTRLIKGYREMGAYVIKHTDGNIMTILDQLISTNPHGLHSLDPMAGIDIKEIKRLYGKRICLIGNVNCALMQTGSEKEIKESCHYAMENGKPGGGYIFSTSNVIFKGVPKTSYDIMIDFYNQNKMY